MLELARCSKKHRILISGSRSIELMFALQQRGYARAAASANCGKPKGQYDVALIDWRQRTLQSLETTLDWLLPFLAPAAVVVIWIDPRKQAVHQILRAALEKRGLAIEAGTVNDAGIAISARRRSAYPLSQAA